MNVISYWQGCMRLTPGIGVCGDAVSLPQDEATASVVIAAILVRNYTRGQSPGWYQARIEEADSVVVVTEDDARVRLARLLLELRAQTEFTARAVAAVRGRVLASTLGESAAPAVSDEGWVTDPAAVRSASGLLPLGGMPGAGRHVRRVLMREEGCGG